MSASLMSDTIVISLHILPGVSRVSRFVGMIMGIQQILLTQKYLVRGAIGMGHLYHNENLIFGKGLVNAYNGHEKLAIYPRVVLVDDDIYWTFHRCMAAEYAKDDEENRGPSYWGPFAERFLDRLFCSDKDGLRFVNYMSENREDLVEIRQVLEDFRTRAYKDKRGDHLAKINWSINYFNEHVARLKLKDSMFDVLPI